MRLGLSRNEVKLVPYDKAWKDAYAKIKLDLMEHVKLDDFRVEHIGSTSIEGINAKPIIDILVGVEHLTKLDAAFFKALQKVGFYRLRVERPEEIVCAKFTDSSYETKTHFLHIVEYDREKWKQLLFFRDYLNAHEEAKRAYETLKQGFFTTNLTGINAYTDYKEGFVHSILEKM